MPKRPETKTVTDYLGNSTSWSSEEIKAAMDAEIAAQAAVVRFPADPEPPAEPLDYPPALLEALCRRVAANLAVRALPLGLQSSMSEMAVSTTRVGGGDREVARLEAPYRRLVVG